MPNKNSDEDNISHHILSTSSNMLGICFLIFSLIKVSQYEAKSIMDEIIAFLIIVFLVACLLSYSSIRFGKRGDLYEKVADIVFLVGLTVLAVMAVIVVSL
jgi:uncharacterized membrane protein